MIVIPQEAVERASGCEFRKRRNGQLVTQQRFGRHDHQRLAEIAQHLAAQGMEVIGRCRAVTDLHIVFGAKLQEALETGRGVLGALPFITMRQQKRQARHAQPLAFARRDELVDQDLRRVAEIAELRLPEHERFGIGQRNAVFKPQNRHLGERAVMHFEARLVVADILQRDVFIFIILVVPDRMAVRKCAAPHILA